MAIDTLQVAHRIFAKSELPILIAGLGLEPESPYEEMLRFTEAIQAPLQAAIKELGSKSNKKFSEFV